jgi:hypothetical protein
MEYQVKLERQRDAILTAKHKASEAQEAEYRERLEDMSPRDAETAKNMLAAFKNKSKQRIATMLRESGGEYFQFQTQIPRHRKMWEEGMERWNPETKQYYYVDGLGMAMPAATFNDRTKTSVTLERTALRRPPFRKDIASRHEYEQAEREAYQEALTESGLDWEELSKDDIYDELLSDRQTSGSRPSSSHRDQGHGSNSVSYRQFRNKKNSHKAK